jgi:hypothetical protein
MPYPWLANFDGPNSANYFPLGHMPVAYNLPLSILITAIFVELNVIQGL